MRNVAWITLPKDRFFGLLVVIYPLVSFTSSDHCGMPFPMDAGKGKCCMWPAIRQEFYFPKIGFLDSKWSNSNAPGLYTPWCHSLLVTTVGCPFLYMQEKGNAASGLLKERNIISQKIGFLDSKWSNLNAPGLYTLGVIHF